MKTTPIPTAQPKTKKETLSYRPPVGIDGRRIIKEQKYGYEYTLVEVLDRPDNMTQPCAMKHQGYALKSFRKLRLKPVI
jgi:hypothetical protein